MPLEKLTPSQFLLIINGPSCGGKSSIADTILAKYGGIFHAKSDSIKWLISDYDAKTHRSIVHEMTMKVTQIALQEGLPVLKEGGLHEVDILLEFCRERKITSFIANVEAPKDVLLRRFHSRIEAKKKGARISNTSEKRFWELYEMYQESKMETPLTFDSSTQSPEEIADNIVSHIRSCFRTT